MCEAAFDFLQWQQPTRGKKKRQQKKQSWTILSAWVEKNAGGGICQDDIRGVMQLICGQESCVVESYAGCIWTRVYIFIHKICCSLYIHPS